MKATNIVNTLLEDEDLDAEAYVKDFADKDQLVTFNFIRSGEFNVYADPPHQYDWLAYSDDKERLANNSLSPLSANTRTFEGYLRPCRDDWTDYLTPQSDQSETGQWMACPKPKPGYANQDEFMGPFPSKEAAAHALYKINRGADKV